MFQPPRLLGPLVYSGPKKQKLQLQALPGYICICIFQYEYFAIYSVHLFCTLWSFEIDLFSNVLFQTFG